MQAHDTKVQLDRGLVQPVRDYFLSLEKSRVAWPEPNSLGYGVLKGSASVAETAQLELSSRLVDELEGLGKSNILSSSDIKVVLDRRLIKGLLSILEDTEMYKSYVGQFLSQYYAAPARRVLNAYCLATDQMIILVDWHKKLKL